MNQNSHQRARFVAALWNLRQSAKSNPIPGIPYIHYNSLLRQPEYRREILDAAEQSNVAELVELAREARALDNGEAALINPEDRAWLEQRDRRIAEAYDRELDSIARDKRRYAMLAAGVAGLAVLVVVGVLLYRQMAGEVQIAGTLDGERRWSADRVYVLEDIVHVPPGARLTIEPGTRILGRPGSALIIARGGFVHAKGTATQPIVFTSAQPEGKRQPGDWGGVVLLGAAPINAGTGFIEGFPAGDPRGVYGGADARHACGVLEFIRIEFAGYEALADNELNGLTLGGCGSDSVFRHIQIHQALDDGLEIFGGTASLSHILITQAHDDALDWDEGWTGSLQFLITQQTIAGDNSIEADNNAEQPDAMPRSRPRIYNATLIGADSGAQRAITLRSGSGGEFGNLLASGHAVEFLDIRLPETARLIDTGELAFDALLLHQVGLQGSSGFAIETGDEDDDGGFDEADYFLNQLTNVSTRPQQRLPIRSQSEITPDFVPVGSTTVTPAALPSGEFWDESARYIGAVRPGTGEPWYAGWTAYPED